jgi:hypothetical protein
MISPDYNPNPVIDARPAGSGARAHRSGASTITLLGSVISSLIELLPLGSRALCGYWRVVTRLGGELRESRLRRKH